MKPNLLVLVGLILGVLFFFSPCWAVCPQDTVDSGICDTMYVEIYPSDSSPLYGFPHFARFLIDVTHDIPNPLIDSICGFVFPFCYTHSNPSKYCSLSYYWNKVLFTPPEVDRSIFRHITHMGYPQINNWMMDLYEQNPNYVWSNLILNLDGTSHFWLALIPTTQPFLGTESHRLLATMTFKLQDTMTICIDTCFWPPSSRLAFFREDAKAYCPRHFLPKCQYIGWYIPHLWFTYCPNNQFHHTNGEFATSFSVQSDEGWITCLSLNFTGQGVENLRIIPPFWPSFHYSGNVAYNVTNHCQAGGTMRLFAMNNLGDSASCYFNINLGNNAPVLNLSDSVSVLANHTASFQVSADDPDQDLVDITMHALWHIPDSLQPPINPPSYSGGNPGVFTWGPTQADTGEWMASFSGADICNKEDTAQIVLLVGMTYCGDCIRDSLIDLSDLVYLITYLFKGGPPPDQQCRADVNCSGEIDLGDPVLLINYLYKGGTAPCFACCDGRFKQGSEKPRAFE